MCLVLSRLPECSNLMNIANVRTSSACKSDLLVPICPFLHTSLRPIRVLLVVDGTADPSKNLSRIPV